MKTLIFYLFALNLGFLIGSASHYKVLNFTNIF